MASIAWLPHPGKYYVVATTLNMVMGGAPEIRTDGTSEVTYGATYYPNTAAKDRSRRGGSYGRRRCHRD